MDAVVFRAAKHEKARQAVLCEGNHTSVTLHMCIAVKFKSRPIFSSNTWELQIQARSIPGPLCFGLYKLLGVITVKG